MYGNDVEYARTRLLNTIVLWKNKPVMVIEILNVNKAIVSTVLDKISRVFAVRLSDLNVLDFTLGFVNYVDGVTKTINATYLTRKPLRNDWRQGLRCENVISSSGNVRITDIGMSLIHRYPTIDKAIDLIDSGNHKKVAWNSEFALGSNHKVYWRFDMVGNLKDGVIHLNENFKFLSKFIGGNSYAGIKMC